MRRRAKRCLRCGEGMLPGMLSGWWTCRCGFFMDLQEAEGFQVVRYEIPGPPGFPGVKAVVPSRCLLVVEEE